ncbi:hypothetical protein [Niallia sp. BSM11]|uniref:hypothetical protein n=1 Tax=Niallia sp. BSM11 TaxID=3391576 RepID=UPI0039849352
MKKKLSDTIKGDFQPEVFQVFAWEAGLGKSKFSTQYIAECIEESTFNSGEIPKYLIVKKFKSDVEETVKALKQSYAYDLFGEDTVVGITSDNWKYWRKNLNKLESCLVLVITHQRYIELCVEELKAPFGNRDTLLIDEKIEFPIYTFSKGNYDKVRPMLLHSLQKELDKVTSPLLEKLEMYQLGNTNEIIVDSVLFDVSKLKDFQNLIEENKESIKGNLNDLITFIEQLIFFYSDEVIYNGGKFYAVNNKMKLRMLSNNIMLDASATVDSIYKGNKFKIIESRRIIDYSRCTFVVVSK